MSEHWGGDRCAGADRARISTCEISILFVEVQAMIDGNRNAGNAPLPDELIDSKDFLLCWLRDRIALFAAAQDHGPCSAGDPRLASEHCCDLCNRQALDGRLVSSEWCHSTETCEGRLRVFAEKLPAGELDWSWLCLRCWRGVRGDRRTLLAELLLGYLAGRN
jgi:hypothetical protein